MAETRKEMEVVQGTAQYWQMELESADQTEKDWRDRGRAVVARYRDERSADSFGAGLYKQFNILWSNTETMKGALFARMPKPDVRRRYSDNNPITRQVAIVLERAFQYGNEVYSADKPIKAALEAESIDRTILSTDDLEIADLCRATGIEIPFMRPKKLAHDDSLAIDNYIYTRMRLSFT